MRAILIVVIVLSASLLAGKPAQAGCCLTGATHYTNFSGALQLPVGDALCWFVFTNCNVTVYHYTPCYEGPDIVVSFRVRMREDCQYIIAGPCSILDSFEIYYTSTGNVHEYSSNC